MVRLRIHHLLVMSVLLTALAAAGCTSTPPNPSFPLSTDDAQAALKEMRHSPRPAQRPIVVIGGYGDPGFGSSKIRSILEPCLVNPQIIRVDPWSTSSFAQARKMLIDAVQQKFPTTDAKFTTEVDLVCSSMGGLVAMYAVNPAACSADASERTLRAARVFTLASPLRGAEAAKMPTFSTMVKDMRPGSQFICTLDACNYCTLCEVVPYTRSDDSFVGAVNTAPPGMNPWWVPAEFFQSGHMTTHDDPRILADIARRLRDEESFTRGQPTPLPAAQPAATQPPPTAPPSKVTASP